MTETDEIPGIDYSRASMLRVQADRAVAFLEPMRAILGKDEDITFIVTSDTIRVRMRDNSSVAMINAEVDIDQAVTNERITDTILKDSIARVRFDRFLDALKSFGEENVAIVLGKDRVFIQSDHGRRTMPLYYSEDWVEPKWPEVSLDFSAFADVKDMRRGAAVDTDSELGDCLTIDVKENGAWSMIVGEDRDMSEVFMGIGTNDTQERMRSTYPRDYVMEILRRVKVPTVRISADKDMPMQMEYREEAYNVSIMLAPRVKR